MSADLRMLQTHLGELQMMFKPEVTITSTYLYELPLPPRAWAVGYTAGYVLPSIRIDVDENERVTGTFTSVYDDDGNLQPAFTIEKPNDDDLDELDMCVAWDIWRYLDGVAVVFALTHLESVYVKLPSETEQAIHESGITHPYSHKYV